MNPAPPHDSLALLRKASGGVAILSILAANGFARTASFQLERVDPGVEVPSISVDELARAREEPGTPPRVIDVRLKEDVDADPVLIPGASWRDPNAVDVWARKLSPTTPIVVYRVRGHWVSQSVTKKLRDMGLNVSQLAGGLEAWKSTGRPTTPVKRR